MTENKIPVSKKLDAMELICNKYSINPSQILRFMPIYYPIGIIKISMQEKIFEDIEQVPYTILRLVELGISEAYQISSLTGISEQYVNSMLEIMQGCHQIENGKLTEFGKLSIRERKSVELCHTEQAFQIDTLTGEILMQKQIIINSELYSANETSEFIVHFQAMKGQYFDEDRIGDYLSSNVEKYLEKKGDIIHTNVEKIDSIDFIETKYAEAYYIELDTYKDKPLIFSMRIDKTEENSDKRFSYQPYYSWSKAQIKDLSLESYIPSIGKDSFSKTTLTNMIALINERDGILQSRENFIYLIQKTIQYYYPLQFDVDELELDQENYLAILYVDEKMIERCNPKLLKLLWFLFQYGAAYIFDENTNGRPIKICTKNSLIGELVKVYGIACKQKSLREVKESIQNEFSYTDCYNNMTLDLIRFIKKEYKINL